MFFKWETPINQLNFGTLLLASYCYCAENPENMAFFKSTDFKQTSNMALQRSQSDIKLLQKVIFSSYHIELKIFIEASCTNNIHTGVKGFCSTRF